MLITKGISPGEIITMKLYSGEEIVSKLVSISDTHYVIKNTRVIGMGNSGPGFMPFLFTVDPDQELPLNKSAVAICLPTDGVLAKQFLESTTGIKLA